MITNKFLYIVTNKDIVNKLKKVGIDNFLFPLKDFCVGFQEPFSIEEITDSSFIFINRILDNASLDQLESLLKTKGKKIKGIVFDDLGVLYLIQKLQLKVEKILYQSHFSTNYESINAMLEYVDSIVVSPDITKEEIDLICKKAKKKVTLFIFGMLPAMYSRRTLLTNFYDTFKLPYKNNIEAYEKMSQNHFVLVENDFGTVGYQKNYYNGFSLLSNKNVSYYLINPLFLNEEEQLELIENLKEKNLKLNITFDEGFLNKETIYKLKGEEK